MHDMSGYSQIHDRMRNLMIANLFQIQVADEEARILVSPLIGGASVAVLFDNPAVIAAFDHLLNVFVEQGGVDAVINQGRRAKWMICPTCHEAGGKESNYGNWHECVDCQGEGTIIIRSDDD